MRKKNSFFPLPLEAEIYNAVGLDPESGRNDVFLLASKVVFDFYDTLPMGIDSKFSPTQLTRFAERILKLDLEKPVKTFVFFYCLRVLGIRDPNAFGNYFKIKGF